MQMDRKAKHVFVISFDGLSALDFDYIKTLPNFGAYISQSSYVRQVHSVYPSLTYPAHATIVTGKYPGNHGVINNTLLQPKRTSPDWYWQRKYIKAQTIFDLAIEQGMKVAALLWPVTAKSKIQYNMPEIFANRRWQNQILISLFNGSPIYQLALNYKYGHLRQGTKQPYLDDFTHQSLLYTIRQKQPNLTLVHFTDLDSMRHYHGFASPQAHNALERHDQRLGEIIRTLKAANIYDKSTLIVLGDHSSLDEDKIINLNVLLRQHGYIDIDNKGRVSSYRAIAKSCDGSAYVYTQPKNGSSLCSELEKVLKNLNQKYSCLEAIYPTAQALEFGADPDCSFILEAKRGYYFLDNIEGEIISSIEPHEVGQKPHYTKAAHGYSPLKDNYATMFFALGKGIKQGVVLDEIHLVDEGPTIAKLLGISLEGVDGRVIEELLEKDIK